MPKSYTAAKPSRNKSAATVLKIKSDIQHPLAGTWLNGFEDEDDVKIVVSGRVDDFKLQVISKLDGEKADIYDPRWDGETLAFNVYWNSTGRFLRCRLQSLAQNKVGYTYTYTATEMWHKEA